MAKASTGIFIVMPSKERIYGLVEFRREDIYTEKDNIVPLYYHSHNCVELRGEFSDGDSVLEDQVFDQSPNGIVDQSANDGCSGAKRSAQATSDIVLATAFPTRELARRVNPPLARIESKHDLAEAQQIELTIGLGRYRDVRHEWYVRNASRRNTRTPLRTT